MFAITSTRIVGLIAVVCAVLVAPQALAAPSTQSRPAPPDATQGDDLSGLGLNELKNERAAFTTATHKSVKAATKTNAAAIKALHRRSVDLDAAYRKLYPGAYRQAVQTSDKAAVWSFPSCSPSAAVEHDSYIYSGDPCMT